MILCNHQVFCCMRKSGYRANCERLAYICFVRRIALLMLMSVQFGQTAVVAAPDEDVTTKAMSVQSIVVREDGNRTANKSDNKRRGSHSRQANSAMFSSAPNLVLSDASGASSQDDVSQERESRIVTPVVFLSLSVRPKKKSLSQGGADDIEIQSAAIEDINGSVVEQLNVLKTRNGFALSAPSASFKAELIPDPDYRTGVINISGANHEYTLHLAPPIGLMMLSNPDRAKDGASAGNKPLHLEQ